MDQNSLVLLSDVGPVFVAGAETVVTSLGVSDGEGVETAAQSEDIARKSAIEFLRPAPADDLPQIPAADQMRHAS